MLRFPALEPQKQEFNSSERIFAGKTILTIATSNSDKGPITILELFDEHDRPENFIFTKLMINH